MPPYVAIPRVVALALPVALGVSTAQAADIIETAEQLERFDGFLHLLEAADMVETLRGEGPFTIFAPTDEAFAEMLPATLDAILDEQNRGPLEAVVQSHIVADAAMLTAGLLGRAVEVATHGGGTLAIDGTTGVILLAPIEVAVTEIDRQVVMEPSEGAAPVSVIVVEATQASGEGFVRLSTSDEQRRTGVAMVVEPDIEADNGVIHGIDLVLLPPEVFWSF